MSWPTGTREEPTSLSAIMAGGCRVVGPNGPRRLGRSGAILSTGKCWSCITSPAQSRTARSAMLRSSGCSPASGRPEAARRPRENRRHRSLGQLGGPRHEPSRERFELIEALAQRRDDDGDAAQPEIKVLTEPIRVDIGRQIAVRGGHDAHVDGTRLQPADPGDLLLLENAQELRLEPERHLADLVQEEGAGLRGLEQTGLRAHRPVKAPRS